MSHDHRPHEEDGQAPVEESAKNDTYWTLWRKSVTDEEFVEKIRKGKASMKRWKWAFVILHLGIISFILGFIPRIIEVTTDFLNMQGPAQPGGIPVIARDVVLIGVSLGFSVGFQFTHSIQTLASLLLPNRPVDLLLKYHELAQQHQRTDHTT